MHWVNLSCGGKLGLEPKIAGIDGIIFRRAFRKPVYLSIEDDEMKLRDARDFWGAVPSGP